MFIDTRAMGFRLTDAIQTHAESRVARALGFASQCISRVVTRLEDVNAERGGVDKRCQIVAFVSGQTPVVAQDVKTDLYAAIDVAAARLRTAVLRQLKRRVALPRRLAARSANRKA